MIPIFFGLRSLSPIRGHCRGDLGELYFLDRSPLPIGEPSSLLQALPEGAERLLRLSNKRLDRFFPDLGKGDIPPRAEVDIPP